jgi:hypothetical protein
MKASRALMAAAGVSVLCILGAGGTFAAVDHPFLSGNEPPVSETPASSPSLSPSPSPIPAPSAIPETPVPNPNPTEAPRISDQGGEQGQFGELGEANQAGEQGQFGELGEANQIGGEQDEFKEHDSPPAGDRTSGK